MVPVLAVVLSLAVHSVPPSLAEPPAGPEPAGEAPSPPVFAVESSVVLLDVVVRDKKGNLIKDLSRTEFEIFEDRERQALSSFRVLDKAPGSTTEPERISPAADGPAPAEAGPVADGGDETRGPAVIAFVFDRMSRESLANAQKAAKAYTRTGHVDGDLVGLFSLDLALHAIQPFTSDLEAVRFALSRVGQQSGTAYANHAGALRELGEQIHRADDTLTAIGAQEYGQADSGTQNLAASVSVQRLFDNMQSRMLQSFDRLERDQQGFASTNGLAAVVSGLRALPGRKTIVFFSEGLSVTTSVLAQFRGVIAAANRANVTIYTIDAGGLRVEDDIKGGREQLDETVRRRLTQEGRGGAGGTDGPMLRGFEQVEDHLRSSRKAGLGQLAEETGGFFVSETNDTGKGFARIQEEMRFHYLLSYAPTDSRFDGRFRSVSVKVTRPGAVVYSRKGYFAIAPDVILPVRPLEAPLLAELDRKPPPNDLPLMAMSLSFPELQRPGRVPVIMRLPLSSVQFDLDESEKTYRADFTFLARFLDARGQEADRMSRRYPVSVPAASLEAALEGEVFFCQETDLAPGRYTLETVALDSQSMKASVRRAPFEVPPAAEGRVRLSDLVILRSIEKLTAEDMGRDNPLYLNDAMLYPNMGDAVEKSKAESVGFYFTAYVPPGAMAPKAAEVEIIKEGTSLARLPIALAEPNGKGRIQHAARLPVAALEAGEYVLRVSVPSEGTAPQQARFVIAN